MEREMSKTLCILPCRLNKKVKTYPFGPIGGKDLWRPQLRAVFVTIIPWKEGVA